MNKSLEGRKAVVTGAAQGIGKAIARALAEAGAKVVISRHQRRRRQNPPPPISATARSA